MTNTNKLYILKLHKVPDGEEIYVNAANILYYGYDASTNHPIIITNSIKNNKFEVLESLQRIEDILVMGEE